MTTNFIVSVANDPGTSSAGTTGGPGTLSYAIAQLNAGSPTGGPYTITLQTDVSLSGSLSPILRSVTIEGGGHTIDAGGATRIFFVGTDQASLQAYPKAVIGQRQQVAIENVTLQGGLAQGGDAGPDGGGGGGLGAGGALFVNQTGDVTLNGVSFSGNGAVGGLGAETYGYSQRGSGGGGLGGDGGDGSPVAAGGGGGLFGKGGNDGGGGGGGVFGTGGDSFGGGGGYSGSGGSSGIRDTPATPNGLPAIEGMGSGGGGGNGSSGFSGGRGGGFGGGQGKDNYIGGDGGFGGGGGGLSGHGGFGGGGGGSGAAGGGGGNGGFGGGGGVDVGSASGQSGFGASAPIKGDPNHFNSRGVGGDGAGLGGAVFVAQGGTLKISGVSTEMGSSAKQGRGDASTGYGAGIFFQGNTSGGTAAFLTFGDGDQAYASQIADLSGAPNGGSAKNGFDSVGGVTGLVKDGTGTLTLSGQNTYTGATTVSGGGTLRLDGSLARGSAVTIGTDATLSGDGAAAGNVTVSGTLSASEAGFAGGSAASYGTLGTGSLELKSSATLVVEIGGVAYDQVAVQGTVRVAGQLDLLVAEGLRFARGTEFTVIANDGRQDRTDGGFLDAAGRTLASEIEVGGHRFRLRYDGGDGNDVTLTALDNNRPEVSGLTQALNFGEDAPTTKLFAASPSVADLDGDTLTATLTLSDAKAGTLEGATATTTLGVYTITGSAAEVSSALSAVTFKPAANYNGSLDVSVAVSDAASGGITETQPSGTVTVTVAAVNDRPEVAQVIGAQSVAEDTAWRFRVPAGSFSDVDEDTLSYTASLADGHPLPGWVSFDAATRTFSGTPPKDFHGTLSFTVTASDGRLSISDTFDLQVRSVNDAPSGTSATIAGSEDAAITLTAASFGFQDADGNGLSGVRFDGLPAGVLTYSGTGEAVVKGTTYDLSNGQSFTLSPATDLNGEAAASLSFRVVDDGGTADGGVDTDTSVRTLTFDLSPTNDAPMAADDMLRLPQVMTANGNVIAGTPGGGADTDFDGDTLAVTAITYRDTQAVADGGQTSIAGRYGTLTIESDGDYSYKAGIEGRLAVGDTGSDTFTYTIDDGFGGTDTATLTLTVTGTSQGTSGDDFFFLTGRATSAAGGRGSDVYVVDGAADRPTEAGGDGNDLDSVLATANYTLAGNADIELLRSLDAGSRAGLTLVGNNLAQKIYGDAGNNTLDGKGGADILRGYEGRDTFMFSSKLGPSNVDHIQDFSARDDTIALDAAIFRAAGRAGTLNANLFKDVTDGAALDANDRILYDRDTGQVSYDADGSGSARAVVFAVLDTKPALTFQDFQVV